MFGQLSALAPGLPFVAILTPILLFWGQVKDAISKLIRLLIVEAQIHSNASQAVMYYLQHVGRRLPTNVLKYSSTFEYIKRTNDIKLIAFEGVRDLKAQWYWFAGNLVMMSDKHGNDKDSGLSFEQAVTLRYLRGTIDIEDFICKAIKWYEQQSDIACAQTNHPRFKVERCVGKKVDRDPSGYGSGGGGYAGGLLKTAADENWRHARLLNYSIDDIGYSSRAFFHVFNPSALRVRDDVEHWLNAKTWYQNKGLLFRRGALLFGAPGSGKSSLIRKIGQSLDLPVYSFELSTMDDQQFIQFWQNARQCQPCIVVMEDIDTVFNKRQPANANIKLSFECLLNCISGVEPAEGIYLFITTNRLEYLDEALGIPNEKGVSTRPGRLDTCFHMGDITLDEKVEIARHFLSDHPDVSARLIDESNGCTVAQFSDMCAQKALELYWMR